MKYLRVSLMFAAILASALVVGCGGTKLSGTPASSVMWEGHFGMDTKYSGRMYLLLGAGALRAPTSDDTEAIIADWNKQHPKGEVVLAADYGSMFTDQPDSKLYWVWLVDGESCLNVELVRQGACGAGTMGVPDIPDTDPPELLVSEEQYQDFRDQVLEAETFAREERLGVWADSPRTETESSDSWSVAEPWDGPAPSPPTLFPVRQGSKWGYINKSGTLVINFKYDDASSFSEGLASVKVGDVWGCIDESGKMVISPRYEQALWFSNGLARVWSSAEKGYVDRSGTLVIRNDPEWAWTSHFSEGLAAVGFEYTMSSDVGYIDTSGKLVIKIAGADSARDFSEGLAVVRKGGYGYIDRNGRFVIDPQFYDADEFSDGLAVVESEFDFDEAKGWIVSQFQIIDAHGNAAVTLDGYSTVGSLREGRAYVFLASAFGMSTLPGPGGEYVPPVAVGFIDETGTLVIPLQFTNAADFRGGLAEVTCEKDKMAYIDLEGNFVWREK